MPERRRRAGRAFVVFTTSSEEADSFAQLRGCIRGGTALVAARSGSAQAGPATLNDIIDRKTSHTLSVVPAKAGIQYAAARAI